jgi:hypothetical protein
MSKDIIPPDRSNLEIKLLAAFRQAEKDGRMDIADDILAAIEAAGRTLVPGRTEILSKVSTGRQTRKIQS